MAIDDLPDEHEQSERVRNWLKENGAGLVGGVALGLAVILGWQWWQRDQARQATSANLEYQAALQGMAGADDAAVRTAIDGLREGDSAYADLAALRLAKMQVEAGDSEQAIATLGEVNADPALQPLVQVRLARLLVDADRSDEAIKALGSARDSASEEVRGDALMAAGKRDEARAAYLDALTLMDVAAPQRRLVELKLTDAGGTPPDPAKPT